MQRSSTTFLLPHSVIERPFLLPNFETVVEQASERKALSIASLISKIAQANGWEHTKHSQGWISSLTEAEKVRQVYAYCFPLNSSTSASICDHKVLTSDVFKESGIPQIRHRLVQASDPTRSMWETASKIAEKYGYPVVVKSVKGSGGVGVELVRTPEELDLAIRKLSRDKADICVSRYKKIVYEYRLIMLDGMPEVIFRKVPPFIIGDGVQSVSALIHSYLTDMNVKRRDKILPHIPFEALTSKHVPQENEQVLLHWKHNLGQGASCVLIGGNSYREVFATETPENDRELVDRLVKIAQMTTKALDARFISVDIAQVVEPLKPHKALRVLEVNSGIMMDHLMEQHGAPGFQLATLVYTKALRASFNESY